MTNRIVLVGALLAALVLPGVLSGQEADPDLVQGFLPKEDLGVLEFRRTHPEADGRGVVVAIIDTGIDLLHPSLQTTSDGRPKVIDFYDATDGGEVELPLTRTLAGGDSGLSGLTGRKLRLGTHAVAGRAFHLGRVAAKSVLPEGVAARVKAEQERQTREEDLKAKDRAFGAQTPPAEAPAPEDPVFDLAAFQDGEGRWRVLVDTDGDGDLGEEKALGEFRETRDVGVFADPLHVGFGVSILAEGRRVVLLTDGGGHGTHVAGIVAAYAGPDSPLNGLAPGAQLIALKIGNHRMGGSTSHLAMHKAIDYARRAGARVLNISFGGDSWFGDGREEAARMLDEAVERWGMLVCVSAGNNGPALNTVGSPGTARRVLTIGAYCSKRTQRTNYGVLDPRREDLFDFSSRGPLTCGSPGVDFVAPGAALSPLPTWHRRRFESWNGTSMAAPQAAGALAVLLSAAQQKGLPTSAAHLAMALRRGARTLPDLLAVEQGAGLIRVGPAFEALAGLPADREPVSFVTETRNPTGVGAGVYDRCVTGEEAFDRSVSVRPDFDERTPASVRAEFGGVYRMSADVDWVETPAQVYLHADGNEVRLRFHPRRMREGLNIARVRGWGVPVEAGSGVAEPAGAMPHDFEIVCTMIRPTVLDGANPIFHAQWTFQPGDRRTAWLRVPAGARLARVDVRETVAGEIPAAYSLALNAPTLWREVGACTQRRRLDLRRDETSSLEFAAEPGSVLEVTVVASWRKGARRDGGLNLDVRFLGVETDPGEVAIPAGRNGGHLRLHAARGPAAGRVEAAIHGRREPLAVAWEVKKDPRHADFFDGETLFEAVGRAGFEGRAGEHLTFDLGFDGEFLDILDDSYVEIRDENRRLLLAEHFWSGRVEFDPPHAGVYDFAVTVHDRGSARVQEKGMMAPALIRRVGPIGVPVYGDLLAGFAPAAAPKGPAQPNGEFSLAPGGRRSFYLRRPDLPGPGEYLGTVTVHDGQGRGVLARVPLRIDTRPAGGPDPAAARALVREEALRTLRRIVRAGSAGEEEKKRGAEAAALLAALDANDLEGRLARAAFRFVTADGVETLEAEATAVVDEGLKDVGNRKELLAGACALRAELRRRAGKLAEAEADLAEGRKHQGESVWLDEVEMRIRRDQGKSKEALDLARRASERDPGNARLRKDLVDAEIAAGNPAKARRIVTDWLDRCPADVAGFEDLLGRVERAESAAAEMEREGGSADGAGKAATPTPEPAGQPEAGK